MKDDPIPGSFPESNLPDSLSIEQLRQNAGGNRPMIQPISGAGAVSPEGADIRDQEPNEKVDEITQETRPV